MKFSSRPLQWFLNVLILFWRIGFTLQDEKRPKCIAFSDIFSSLFYFQFSIFSPLTIRASCHKLTQDKLVISWNLFFKRLFFWIRVIVSFFSYYYDYLLQKLEEINLLFLLLSIGWQIECVNRAMFLGLSLVFNLQNTLRVPPFTEIWKWMLSTKTNSFRGSKDSWALRESTGPTHFLSKYSGGYANKPSLPRILMKVILFQAGYEGLFSSACSISFLTRLSIRADYTNIPY